MTRKAMPKRTVLVTALAVGLGISGLAFGQATSGSLFGTAPAGDTVQVSGSGITRTVTVGTNGQWSVGSLPLGTYTVNLMKDGQTVASQSNVTVHVGAGVAVNLAPGAAQNAQNLGAVQVTANALPTIDVTQVHNSTIITAQQLRALPVQHNAFSIALLTPGTLSSTAFGNTLTFGGSAGSENAYYVNGYNTGAPYRNMQGFFLPYGAIGQQQTLAGGFGAKYGRSDGGVISQTGKRGTNEWHFGGQIRWEPASIQATPNDIYWPVETPPSTVFAGGNKITNASGYTPNALQHDYSDNRSWNTTYTAYVGGPIVKDKLFFFVDVAVNETKSSQYGSVTNPVVSLSSSHDTTTYGKVDWNINDNNIVEFTYLGEQGKSGQGATDTVDPDTRAVTGLASINNQNIDNSKYFIVHYTSYLSDNATLSVLYGHGKYQNPILYATSEANPYVGSGRFAQNCALFPAAQAALCNEGLTIPFPAVQTNASVTSPKRQTSSHGLRVDFTYQLGNHKLGVGIDNMYYYATDQGTHYTGPAAPPEVTPFNGSDLSATRWIYGRVLSTSSAFAPITATQPQGIGADGNFYYVRWLNIGNLAGMRTKQKAFYLQDNWQITPNLLAVIGLRDDQYVNYNNLGGAFVNMKNQISPRIGASWDVFGDSSLKIYGNIGRYYLALPLNAANRAADSSVYLWQYFTYTAIDPGTGAPSGLKPIYGTGTSLDSPAGCNSAACTHVISPDGEFGGFKDPKQVTAGNLKPQYVDQINLGFDAKLGEHWQYGASVHYRKTGTVIDDECQPGAIAAKMVKMGLDPDAYSYSLYYGPAYCRLINPGGTSDMLLKKGTTAAESDGATGYTTIPMTFKDWGYPEKPKRTYAALDLYFQRNFDGKWAGRIDYTYASGFGNTSGQLRPDFAQADVSKTEDWDYPAIMVGQYGQLMNVRRHMFRLRGSYQITPEFRVGVVGVIASGTAQECLGFYGPEANENPPPGYGGGNYHWCAGRIVHPGSADPLAGHTPWTHQYNLTFTYMPAFADHRLSAQVIIYNVTNEQNTTQSSPTFAASGSVPYQISNSFHMVSSREAPRAIEFVLSYDY